MGITKNYNRTPQSNYQRRKKVKRNPYNRDDRYLEKRPQRFSNRGNNRNDRARAFEKEKRIPKFKGGENTSVKNEHTLDFFLSTLNLKSNLKKLLPKVFDRHFRFIDIKENQNKVLKYLKRYAELAFFVGKKDKKIKHKGCVFANDIHNAFSYVKKKDPIMSNFSIENKFTKELLRTSINGRLKIKIQANENDIDTLEKIIDNQKRLVGDSAEKVKEAFTNYAPKGNEFPLLKNELDSCAKYIDSKMDSHLKFYLEKTKIKWMKFKPKAIREEDFNMPIKVFELKDGNKEVTRQVDDYVTSFFDYLLFYKFKLPEYNKIHFLQWIKKFNNFFAIDVNIPPEYRIILRKGYKFTPNYFVNKNEFIQNAIESITRWCNPSTRITPRIMAKLSFVDELSNSFANIDYNNLCKNVKANLSKNEMKILEKIRNDKTMHVSNSDKNMGLVIFSNNWKETEIRKHLSNTKIYKQVTKNTVLSNLMSNCSTLYSRINKFVQSGIVTKSMKPIFDSTIWYGFEIAIHDLIKVIKEDKIPFPTFKILPKMHKNPPTSRSIIDQHKSYSKKIDKLLLKVMRFALDNHPFANKKIIESTAQLQLFIQNFNSRKIKEKISLHTMDAVSMYTNFKKETILSSWKTIFQFYVDHATQNKTQKQIEVNLIMEILTFFLNNQYFHCEEFNTFFQQLGSLIMGSFSSSVAANGTLGVCEMFYLEKYSIARYIDNIFLITFGQHSKKISNDVLTTYNLYIPTIFEEQGTSVVVLDCKISVDPRNTLVSTHYYKPMNKFQYAPFDTNLLQKNFKSVILGCANRCAITCSSYKEWDNTLTFYMLKLLELEYPKYFINNTLRNFKYESSRQKQLENARSTDNEGTRNLRLEIKIDYTPKPQLRIKVPIIKGFDYKAFKDMAQLSWQSLKPLFPQVLSDTPDVQIIQFKKGNIGQYTKSKHPKKIFM